MRYYIAFSIYSMTFLCIGSIAVSFCSARTVPLPFKYYITRSGRECYRRIYSTHSSIITYKEIQKILQDACEDYKKVHESANVTSINKISVKKSKNSPVKGEVCKRCNDKVLYKNKGHLLAHYKYAHSKNKFFISLPKRDDSKSVISYSDAQLKEQKINVNSNSNQLILLTEYLVFENSSETDVFAFNHDIEY